MKPPERRRPLPCDHSAGRPPVILRSALLVVLLAALPAALAAAPSVRTRQAVPSTAAKAAAAWYEVRSGDVLGSIAKRFGCTIGELRRASDLSSDLIRPGQRLRLPVPFARSGDAVTWRCPLESPGRCLRGFGVQQVTDRVRVPHTGADLQASLGTRVHAPADGIVRYVGGQEDFGTLVIIEHAGGWSSVLAPLAPGSVRVARDQAVVRGDLLGLVGEPEELDRGYLHVELRRQGKAVEPDPLRQ